MQRPHNMQEPKNTHSSQFEGVSDPCKSHTPCAGRTSPQEALSTHPHNIVLTSRRCLCKKSKCQICTHALLFFSATTTDEDKMYSTTGTNDIPYWAGHAKDKAH